MEIKILGTGCPNCRTLEKRTKKAVTELGLEAEVIKEEDITKIMSYGIPRTPGLVVDGNILVSGRVPDVNEIKELLTQ